MRKSFLKYYARFVLFFLVVAFLGFVACSSNDDDNNEEITPQPPILSTKSDATIVFQSQYNPDWIVTLPDVKLDNVTITPATAVQLNLIVRDEITEETAKMHTYEVVPFPGPDRESSRKGGPDLYWNSFSKGYYLTAFQRTYFSDFSESGNYYYNVPLAEKIELYRSITVVRPDGREVLFQVNILTHSQMNNPQNGGTLDNSFKMQDLITNYITTTPQNYQYFVTSADYVEGGSSGFAVFEWSDIQGAHYSREPGRDRVFFPSQPANMTGTLRLRNVIRIELMPKLGD
ncbi:MAG: hypothetical protein FWG98_10590 [Candidatus Cloacimonetes bacterium]|nr:hypothetical protein [Candidatus Cloacimonadota bacterium]